MTRIPAKDLPWRRTLHAEFCEAEAKRKKKRMCFWCVAALDKGHAPGCPTMPKTRETR
jgi:hypothetical protein